MEYNRLKIRKSFDEVFFTSDLHLNHSRLLEKPSCLRKRCIQYREGETPVQTMNRMILEQWEQTVTATGTVFCLGDVAFSLMDNIGDRLSSLPGTKYLLRGNHDTRLPPLWEKGWDGFLSLSVTDPQLGKTIHAVISHYPMLSWKDSHYGTWCLHGHQHGVNNRAVPDSFDVGVDTAIMNVIPRPLPFAPYSLSELISIIGEPRHWQGECEARGHHHDLENA